MTSDSNNEWDLVESVFGDTAADLRTCVDERKLVELANLLVRVFNREAAELIRRPVPGLQGRSVFRVLEAGNSDAIVYMIDRLG